ncbi:MAG: BON domain-containing protein [Acidobacteria bacterium]|nr:BON domain-containing protein [Acidobacteriota bacterium]
MAKTIVAALVAFLTFESPLAASAQMNIRDRLVFDQISDQVNRYTRYTIFDSLSAAVENGRVTLTGWVTMPYKRDDIDRRIRRIDGVVSLENAVQVLPVSQFDDQLRFRIAKAIYGHSSFWQYASMANPPIHIVVNHGRVSLEGVVNSNVERMLARSLAGGFGALDVTNRLRTDAEVRESLASGN